MVDNVMRTVNSPCAGEPKLRRGDSEQRLRRCCARPISQFEKYVKLSKKVPAEVLTSLTGIDEPVVWLIPSPRT